jgi:hypothetical protein
MLHGLLSNKIIIIPIKKNMWTMTFLATQVKQNWGSSNPCTMTFLGRYDL